MSDRVVAKELGGDCVAVCSQTLRILTIDVEEWFHCDMRGTELTWPARASRLEAELEQILTSLSETGQRATFFWLGWCAHRFPRLVAEVKAAGHEIGCHSNLHREARSLTPSLFREDTRRAISVLQDITGDSVTMYRAPAFSVNQSCTWVFDELAYLGVTADSSIFPASRDYGGWRNFSESTPFRIQTVAGVIHEFPVPPYRRGRFCLPFSGGGYFRLMPYVLFKHCLGSSKYVMTYFHPRDFDPAQPRLEHESYLRYFKAYCGLNSALGRFQRMLKDFKFVSVGQAMTMVNWDARDVVHSSLLT